MCWGLRWVFLRTGLVEALPVARRATGFSVPSETRLLLYLAMQISETVVGIGKERWGRVAWRQPLFRLSISWLQAGCSWLAGSLVGRSLHSYSFTPCRWVVWRLVWRPVGLYWPFFRAVVAVL
eukprot:c20223_g2_i1 orf=235-603(-)